MPVTETGGPGPFPVEQVLGIITRGDLLRALRERPSGEPHAVTVDLGDRLRTLDGLERLWPAVAAAAGGVTGLYLVGGAVRDLLLGEPGFDVDLAVEGDGVAFARRLARELGGAATRTRSSTPPW